MSLLKTEPPAPVRSLGELFAIAHALEDESASRYAELAAQMEALDLPVVAEVFRHLVAEERGHADQVEGWARSETGTAPDPAWIRWRPPETFDEEEARTFASSSLASAYRALSMAVRNEERAFALWTYIAAQTEDPAIRAAAERMAGEELRHAALLRRERRRAYHAERGRHAAKPSSALRLPPAAEAARIERSLAGLLSALADGDVTTARVPELRRLAAEAERMANEATAEGGAALAPGQGDDASRSEPENATPHGPTEALRLAERAVEAYLDAADAARDEDGMRRLQSLAERAIARNVLLRRMAGRD